MTNLDRITDAAVACALRQDHDGYNALVAELDADQARDVAWGIARHTATCMIERLEDAGLEPARELALTMWQQVMLHQAGHGSE